MKHFVSTTTVKFKVDGIEFEYLPMTAGDELDNADKYIIMVNGKPQQDFKQITELKLKRIKNASYDINTIKSITRKDTFKQLSDNEKVDLFKKMHPTVFNKIIIKINEIDNGGGDDLKN